MMSHSTPAEPLEPAVVSENLNHGTLTVHFATASGAVHEFEIPLEGAERLATCLRDRASAVRTFIDLYRRPEPRRDLAY